MAKGNRGGKRGSSINDVVKRINNGEKIKVLTELGDRTDKEYEVIARALRRQGRRRELTNAEKLIVEEIALKRVNVEVPQKLKQLEKSVKDDYTNFINYKNYMTDYSDKSFKLKYKANTGVTVTEYIPKSQVDKDGNIKLWVAQDKGIPRVRINKNLLLYNTKVKTSEKTKYEKELQDNLKEIEEEIKYIKNKMQ